MENQNLIGYSTPRKITEIDVKKFIGYLTEMFGLTENEIPSSENIRVIVNFILKYYSSFSLNELIACVDLSINRKINVDLSLYGKRLNMFYLSNILNEYNKYKQLNAISLPVKSEEASTLKIRSASILDLIKERNPETLEKINEIGKGKYVSKDFEIKENIHQSLMRDFFKLSEEQSDGKEIVGIRIVEYNGKMMDVQTYVNERLNEILNDC